MSRVSHPEPLLAAFPLHLRLDRAGRVRHVSDPAARLLGCRSGEPLWERLELVRPRRDAPPADPAALEGRVVLVARRDRPEARLRGQVIPVDGATRLLVGSPAVRDLHTLGELGLSARDLPPHDATADLLTSVAAQRQTLRELERTVGALREAQGDLARRNQELAEALRVRERLETRLVERGKLEALGELVGGITHDYNNLLTAILGHAEWGRDETADRRARDAFQDILEAGERAAGLTRRLLAFARGGAVSPGVTDLSMALPELGTLLDRLLPAGIHLLVEAERDGLPVPLDPTALEQVVLNLVFNARDAMPEGGAITVRAGAQALDAARAQGLQIPPGRYVRLQVRDQGTGIPPELRDRLFEPFFTTKGPGRGTGLGLSTVWGVVREVEGTVEVASTEGLGSTFTVWLPEAQPVEVDRRPARSAESAAPARSASILLVEDEASVRRVVARLLSRAGHRVVPVGDTASARQAFDLGMDLVVTDLTLPDGDGLDVADHVRGQTGGSVPVVVMTGFHRHPDLGRRVREGEVRLLPKPFDRERLIRTVEAALAGAEPPSLPSVWDRSLEL